MKETNTHKEEENENGNDYQGLIRKVPQAHLVYKRQDKTGTFEELWIYKIKQNMKGDYEIRNAILAGSDIPKNKTKSDDGEQVYELWSVGNVQFLNLKGLPS